MTHYRMVCGPAENTPRSAVALVIAQRRSATLASVPALTRARDYAARHGYAATVEKLDAALVATQSALDALNAADAALPPNFD